MIDVLTDAKAYRQNIAGAIVRSFHHEYLRRYPNL